MAQTAFRFETEVQAGGNVGVRVPVPPGTTVEVLVLTPPNDGCEDLIQAAGSSLDFWDNPTDDEAWNHA